MNEKFFYGFNHLRLKPIIYYEDVYYCPIMTFLLWQMTEGVYYQFLDNSTFLTNIGSAFESYVGYILGKIDNPNGFKIYPEQTYGRTSEKSSDWLLEDKRIHALNSMGHNWWSACAYMAGVASIAVRNEVPEASAWARDIMEASKEWFAFSGSILENKPANFDAAGGFQVGER